MSANVAALLYLAAGVLFILALRGLSSPATSRRGNLFGMVGMAIAILTTLGLAQPTAVSWILIIVGLSIGGFIGAKIAREIPMTMMPELVAAFHSLVGLAAVFVAASALYAPSAFGILANPADPSLGIKGGSLFEMALGVAIGAITFTGSVIAFAKLSGRMSGKPILLPMRHVINAGLGLFLVFLIYGFIVSGGSAWLFWLITFCSLLIGVLIIIPIGGADMPVVISMLNSYSGWAAAGIGFTLGNVALIITGALVGSSGAILSYIMCKGMNRQFLSVIAGGFGGETAAAGAGGGEQKPVKLGSAEDAGYVLQNAAKVIIVPGYGMAVAQAQHALREMADASEEGRRRSEVRHSPGCRPHAGPHERASRRSQRSLRRDLRTRRHQQRVCPSRCRVRHRRQRRRQSGGRGRQILADLRDAGAAGLEGWNGLLQQALAGVGLCRHRQPGFLSR